MMAPVTYRWAVRTLVVVGSLILHAAPITAQKEFETYAVMQELNTALGVGCTYCHVTGADKQVNYKSEENPKKVIARKMMEMTTDINARIWLATGNESAKEKGVTCGSCHRGTPIPLPIGAIVSKAIDQAGPAAGVARYRELRTQFYERDAYDFTEAELLRIAKSYTDTNPDATIALLRMNVEWRPASAVSYVVMAYAYTRKLDDASAIPLLQKALEIEPENGTARGFLHQLQQFQRKPPK